MTKIFICYNIVLKGGINIKLKEESEKIAQKEGRNFMRLLKRIARGLSAAILKNNSDGLKFVSPEELDEREKKITEELKKEGLE